MTIKTAILAIDTGREYLSLAIKSNDTMGSMLIKADNKQSTFILPHIKALLDKHGLCIQNISQIAYNQGPGSFTGLRIGISIAMGIAYGLGIDLIAVPSFAIYANAIKNKLTTKKVLIGIDARLGQMYLAGLNLTDFTYFIEPHLANPNEIQLIKDCDVCGNGFEIYKDQLHVNMQNINYVKNEDIYPSALNLIELCQYYSPKTPQGSEILYVRNKIALNLEEQYANKQS